MKVVAQEEYPVDLVNAWDDPCVPNGKRITLWTLLNGTYDLEDARADFKRWVELQGDEREVRAMLLDQHERDKFAAYCVQQSSTDKAMADQMESLGPEHGPLVKKMRDRALAYGLVAVDLNTAGDFSISTDDEREGSE